jgi:hypothetical protein
MTKLRKSNISKSQEEVEKRGMRCTQRRSRKKQKVARRPQSVGRNVDKNQKIPSRAMLLLCSTHYNETKHQITPWLSLSPSCNRHFFSLWVAVVRTL